MTIVATAIFGGAPLDASASPLTVNGGSSGFSACGNPGNTNSTTVTATGGKPPYQYSWALQGAQATSGPFQANSPTSATTSFSDANGQVCDTDPVTSETWRCTVTDDNLDTVTVDVTVTLTWVNLN